MTWFTWKLLHVLLLFFYPENPFSVAEMSEFVGALIQMQWLSKLILSSKCAKVTITLNLIFSLYIHPCKEIAESPNTATHKNKTIETLVCFLVNAPDNEIGYAGAAALVEGLKEMTNLKELYLYGECCMVGIVCEVAVMSCMKQIAR